MVFEDLEGFAPPPIPAADDEIPEPDRRRVVAILDPVPISSGYAARGPELGP
jgi:hypothetical protein